jgi:hypothetical protein
MSWRTCHLVVGGLGLLLFILQGQYMARVLGVMELPDAARMMYRSAHIYLLLACVANVTIGYYMTPAVVMNHLQRLVSIVLLISPALLIWSFFAESTAENLERPIAQASLYLLFGAGVLMLLQELYRKLRRGSSG